MSDHDLIPSRQHFTHTEREMVTNFNITHINRRAMEKAVDMCMHCYSGRLSDCTCHSRGYN